MKSGIVQRFLNCMLRVLVFSIFSFLFLFENCSAGDFSWPMFMGAIIQGNEERCTGEWNGPTTGTYENRVAEFKARYCKSDEWETWMLANSARYSSAFEASKQLPSIIIISFRYETTPIDYSPPWINEDEHMSVFKVMAQGTYPNYNFNFVVNGDTTSSYANVIAGTVGTTSYAFGKNMYLYYETIFNHEFAHVMHLPHHYDVISETGHGKHMPPGETKCIMDRSSSLLCSACATAIGVPLDVTGTSAMDGAMNDIISRYPY